MCMPAKVSGGAEVGALEAKTESYKPEAGAETAGKSYQKVTENEAEIMKMIEKR